MKHSWTHIRKQEYKCKRCGCNKEHFKGMDFYNRNGIFYDYRPDCIDEEEEKKKTID